MAILSILLTVVIIATSILMVLIVLVQRPKQEGLGAAFGGGTLDSALGAHTTDILQKITTWLGIIFFVSAIGLAMIKTRQFSQSAASDVLENVENRDSQSPVIDPSLGSLPDIEDSPASSDPLSESDPLEDPLETPSSPEAGFELPGAEGVTTDEPADAAPETESADETPQADADAGESPEGESKE